MIDRSKFDEPEVHVQPFKFPSESGIVDKDSTQPSEMANTPADREVNMNNKDRESKEQQTLSLEVKSKPNPFRFFEDPDGYEDEKKQGTGPIDMFATTMSAIPLNIGDRLDVSDLNKAKYMNPSKRRKMSYSDFENRVEDSNFTLLDLLVMCKADKTILEFLENQLSHVFEITKTFEDGRGFLYYAIKRNFDQVIQEMINLNKDILNLIDKHGRVPLHYACSDGKFKIVKMMIENGAELNIQDNQGNTPLHYSLMFQYFGTGSYLVSNGCEKNIQNVYGLTPLDYLPQMVGKEFSILGMEHGDSGCLPGPDGLNSESMYKRRFDLLMRKKKILPNREKTSFSDCYTERDKGNQVKPLLSMFNVNPTQENNEKETEPDNSGSPGKFNSPDPRAKRNPTTTFTGLESPQNAYTAPANDPNDAAGNNLDSPTPAMTPIVDINRKVMHAHFDISDPRKMTHKDYTLIDVIGSGSFGEVYLVSSKRDNQYFAMKVYSKQKIIRNGLLKFLFLEKKILVNFDHPFLVKVYATFQTPRKLYLVMDYCKYKDLGQYLTQNEKLPEHQTRLLLAELVLAVEELHRRNIIHRDLKPDNILIEQDGHIKITDFGLSKDNLPKGKLTSTFCGSIAYLPPEIVKRVGHGQVADWYLVGELLYECLFGVPPFFSTSKKLLLTSIINDEVKFPNYINRCTKDLILRLMCKEPENRLGARGGAKEVKEHPFFTGIDWEAVFNKKYKLFETKDITPYQPLSYNQDIVDNQDNKGGSNKVLNWSVCR